jgi:hypothetical protein
VQVRRRFRQRHPQKGPCLVEGVAEPVETAIEPDEVEQIAVFASGGVGLMFNCT